MLKLMSPPARAMYFSCTILATSCRSAPLSAVLNYADFEQVGARSTIEGTLSPAIKLDDPVLTTDQREMSKGIRPRRTHPLSLVASMKVIKCVSISRSSGTADCPV